MTQRSGSFVRILVRNDAVRAYLEEVWRGWQLVISSDPLSGERLLPAQPPEQLPPDVVWVSEKTPLDLMVYEWENYFLDWEAIEASPLNRESLKVPGIEWNAHGIAEKMQWWMVAKMLLDGYRDQLNDSFPELPEKESLFDLRTAEEFITGTRWFQSVGEASAGMRKNLTKDIHAAYHLCHNWFDSDEWVRKFSGAEIVRCLIPRLSPKPYAPLPAMTADLARSIGAFQRTNHTVPAELQRLPDLLLGNPVPVLRPVRIHLGEAPDFGV